MKKHRVGFLLCVAVGMVCGMLWYAWSVLGIGRLNTSEESYMKIEKGMSLQDVEAILGGPPANYRRSMRLRRILISGAVVREWGSNRGSISVGFDENDRVVSTAFDP